MKPKKLKQAKEAKNQWRYTCVNIRYWGKDSHKAEYAAYQSNSTKNKEIANGHNHHKSVKKKKDAKNQYKKEK